jgi:AcrR family transcriptional regulator
MPRIVDSEARREEIAEAIWRVIAKHGMEAVTVREIAKEACCTTGMLVHYFKNKDELILHALRTTTMRIGGRMWERGEQAAGDDVLREVLLGALPLNEESRAEWKIWVYFWCRATNNALMAQEQLRWYVEYRSCVRSLIAEGQRAGHFRADINPEEEADSIIAFVDGIGMQATLDPQRFPAEYQTALLDRRIAYLT